MARVIDTDRGLRALRAQFEKFKDLVVVVGVRQDDGNVEGEGGVRVADYATFNELGIGAPERSFLRSTFDANAEIYAEYLVEALRRWLQRGGDLIHDLEMVGVVVARDVQRTIIDLSDPPNHPRTIAAKKSSNPLIDHGVLVRSISHELRMDPRDVDAVLKDAPTLPGRAS